MDKVCHFSEFLPYGWFWLRAIRGSAVGMRWNRALWLALSAAATVAALDEYVQSFVPMKVRAFDDWLADLWGAAAGAFFYYRWRSTRTP